MIIQEKKNEILELYQKHDLEKEAREILEDFEE